MVSFKFSYLMNNGQTAFFEELVLRFGAQWSREKVDIEQVGHLVFYADADKWVFISKGFKNLNIICVGYSPELKHSTEIQIWRSLKCRSSH